MEAQLRVDFKATQLQRDSILFELFAIVFIEVLKKPQLNKPVK